ncbi:MAG TPA: hypothetical protein VGE62_02680 [Candidatus Paceibacterota bacterium]
MYPKCNASRFAAMAGDAAPTEKWLNFNFFLFLLFTKNLATGITPAEKL